MKYRKKPVVIEAAQIKEMNPNLEGGFCVRGFDIDWLWQAHEEGVVRACTDRVLIDTLEGTMTAMPGDYIIRGVKGELYPCKPDIFEATYEPVTPPQEKDDE